MKKCILFLIIILVLLPACKPMEMISGKLSKQESKQSARLDKLDDEKSKLNSDKLDKIGVISVGIDYSLSKIENKSPASILAYDLNKRVMSLSHQPDIDQTKLMWTMVDELLAELDAGSNKLNQLDKEISKLQLDIKNNQLTSDQAIEDYRNKAKEAAGIADTTKASLHKMDRWLGLGAIWYGVKKLCMSLFWMIVSVSGLYLIIRLAAASNPIAGSLLGVVEMVGSWFVSLFKLILPRSVEMAGHVSSTKHQQYQSILIKFIDTVQFFKTSAKLSKLNKQDIKLNDILEELEKKLNEDEKEKIEEIKKKLGY